MQVIVRKATPGDAAALAGLRWQMSAKDRANPGPDHDYVASFSAWVSDHSSTHLPFLAEVDDGTVGMAWLMVAERPPDPARPYRRCGDVQSVYVVPSLRGRGIGAVLLDAVLAKAGELELEHVTVHSSERAVPLYLRSGFRHDERWLSWNPE
jgi:GNAT superfamily N-acetyltransferase